MKEVNYAMADFAITSKVAESIMAAWHLDPDLFIDKQDSDMILCAVFSEMVAESDEIFSKSICASDVCGVSVCSAFEYDSDEYFDHSIVIRFVGKDGEAMAGPAGRDCFQFKINSMDHFEDTFVCIVEAARAMSEGCFKLDACVIYSSEVVTPQGDSDDDMHSALISLGGRI